MRKCLLGITIMMAAFGLQGCDKNVYYAVEKDVDETGWNMNDPVDFEVDFEDTLQVYDFFIDVRNSVHYNKANTFFFIHTTFPDGSVAYDTLECPLADVEGHWYGHRTGRYVDSRFVFQRHVIIPRAGRYHFQLYHAMRDTNLVGLKSVGLHIEYFGN
ncbi:MAG: gliding motility lipoprotein GldH [Bacteroidales bacterium]|nr:gliding motility lipoprotein GldH [Bacteroidales bacterium]MBR3413036.1 gliding motility lipoprotein GldH [Bacteroidales bacterium]